MFFVNVGAVAVIGSICELLQYASPLSHIFLAVRAPAHSLQHDPAQSTRKQWILLRRRLSSVMPACATFASALQRESQHVRRCSSFSRAEAPGRKDSGTAPFTALSRQNMTASSCPALSRRSWHVAERKENCEPGGRKNRHTAPAAQCRYAFHACSCVLAGWLAAQHSKTVQSEEICCGLLEGRRSCS